MNRFNLDSEEMKDLKQELSLVPAEEVFEIYGDTVLQFALLRTKLNSGTEEERNEAMKAKEELKEQLKTRLDQLFKSNGVDLSKVKELIKKNNKTQEIGVII